MMIMKMMMTGMIIVLIVIAYVHLSVHKYMMYRRYLRSPSHPPLFGTDRS